MRLVSRVRKADVEQANVRIEAIQYLIDYGDDIALTTEATGYLLEELGEYVRWVKQIYKKFENYPEYVNERKLRYELGIVDFVLPEQLDRTSWEDLYDRQKWINFHEVLKENNTHCHGSKYAKTQESTLSYGLNLRQEVTGVRVLHDKTTNPWGIIPEISRISYKRRCIFIDQEGRRCACYASKDIICRHHRWAKKYLKGYLMSHGSTYSEAFKSTSLKEMYEDFMKADARDLRGEIALQRTMLASVVKKLDESMNGEQVPLDLIEFIITLSGKLSTTIKRYDDMQQKLGLLITPDQLNRIMMRILETVRDVLNVSHEDFLMLANAFANLEFAHKNPESLLHLTEKVTVDSNYGANQPPGKPIVTHSSRTTRYLKNGGVVEIDAQVEVDEYNNKVDHLEDRYGLTRTESNMPTEEQHKPHTRVAGVEVPLVMTNKEVRALNEIQAGDENDPFVV